MHRRTWQRVDRVLVSLCPFLSRYAYELELTGGSTRWCCPLSCFSLSRSLCRFIVICQELLQCIDSLKPTFSTAFTLEGLVTQNPNHVVENRARVAYRMFNVCCAQRLHPSTCVVLCDYYLQVRCVQLQLFLRFVVFVIGVNKLFLDSGGIIIIKKI